LHNQNRPSRFFADFQVCRKAGNWYKGINKPGAAAGLFREHAVIFIDTHRPRFYTVFPVQLCSYEAGRETVCFAVFSFYAGNDETF
jgi:hypothetical protein